MPRTASPQAPTLETPEGGIFESNAIARYVARLADKGLLGATPIEAVRVWNCVPLPAVPRRVADRVKHACSILLLHQKGVRCCSSFLQAQVDMWIDFSSNEIDAPLMSWLIPLWGIWPYDKKVPLAPPPPHQRA